VLRQLQNKAVRGLTTAAYNKQIKRKNRACFVFCKERKKANQSLFSSYLGVSLFHKLAYYLRYNYNVIMTTYKFEWDPNKADSNRIKHGVSFDEAKSVFYDDRGRLIPDPDSSIYEERFILLGQSSEFKTLIVCHCYRDENESIRIISARKADKGERKQYEGFHYA
jgi:uncharacterized DUF497 family protein